MTSWRVGWEGVRETQEGGVICILMTDSHWHMAEINTTLQSNYLPIKNKNNGQKILIYISTKKIYGEFPVNQLGAHTFSGPRAQVQFQVGRRYTDVK